MIARAGPAVYEALITQKDRVFLWAPVFVGLGIALYFSVRAEPWGWMGPFLCGAAVAGGVCLRGRPVMRALCFLAALVALGFALAQIRTQVVHTPMLAKKLGPVNVEGTIAQIEPLEEVRGSRLLLEDLRIERLTPEDTPRRVRLTVRKAEGLIAGQRITVLAMLNPPSGPVRPGAFDFQRYAYFKGIGAVGFVFKISDTVGDMPAPPFFERLRHRIIARVEAAVPTPYAAFVVTLLTGYKGGIREDDRQAMRDSGLAHLLAISGLHVGMVAGALFFFARLCMAAWPWLALHYPIKKIAAGIALTGAVFYTCTIGAGIPAQRALMMTGLVLIAIIFDRSPFSPRLVALAALVILILFPDSLTGVSFQMSFAAVAALVLFYDWSRPFWRRMHSQAGMIRKGLLYMAGVLMTTVIAGLATGFFSLYHFQTFALYGVIANMVAVPIMAFIVMPAAVASYALMPLGFEGAALAVMQWGISWILAAAQWTAGLEDAVVHVRAWPPVTFMLVIAGTVFMALWRGRARSAGLVAVVAGLALIPLHRPPDILIADSFKLVALRGDDGSLSFSSGRAERFVAENWQRLNGDEGQRRAVWPREGDVSGMDMRCGENGCRAIVAGHRVAVPRTRGGMAEDCRWAEILIYADPAGKECGARYRFDRFDTYRHGAYALWLEEGDVSIRSVFSERGMRPWAGIVWKNKDFRF